MTCRSKRILQRQAHCQTGMLHQRMPTDVKQALLAAQKDFDTIYEDPDKFDKKKNKFKEVFEELLVHGLGRQTVQWIELRS